MKGQFRLVEQRAGELRRHGCKVLAMPDGVEQGDARQGHPSIS
jgi:hypothetical protein